jgi:hypothetical protein
MVSMRQKQAARQSTETDGEQDVKVTAGTASARDCAGAQIARYSLVSMKHPILCVDVWILPNAPPAPAP